MTEFHIPNFVEGSNVRVHAYVHTACGNLVAISQDGGSMSFLHHMTPAQAIEMADALICCAVSLDPAAVSVKEVAHAE